ncbi:HupE-UreJ family metal transporter [Duganella sp. FT135W]|uniref:HupE-UreJ family metal transporter n=1 Tax=Duganella flavida TaxID=2692175 RepID=A0A6L8KEC9_9BURK|nr:HupE/UreJ family protein [Duganella flavida]MYM25819.1 HupE-UreJ family metal transporter [Duganella flavida]
MKKIAALTLALVSTAAFAHTGTGAHSHGFLSGFAHPFTGLDHLLAMLAVGAWSVRQPNAKWLPATFIGMLLVGVATGAAGFTVPGLETGIALTVALMGVLLAVAVRLPAAASTVMVGVFALLHGNAHGHELPQAASAVGLLVASALLVYGGKLLGRVSPALAVKASGAAIAATGVMLAATA